MAENKDFGFLPESEGKLLKESRWLDVVQPLIALGYLRPSDLSGIPTLDQGKILLAIKSLCREAKVLGLSFSYLLDGGEANLDGMSLEWLNQMLALEGEFPLDYSPKEGELNLWTRLLHFRLWLFGLYYQDRIQLPWSNDSELALAQFQRFFSCQRPKAMDLLCSIHKVIDQMLDEPHFFHGRPKLAFVELPSTLDGLPGKNKQRRFWKQLEKDLGGSVAEAYREKFEDEGLDLQPFLADPANRFALRVLRVYQWVKGYYRGDLGPAFHQKSLDSLNDLAEAENLDLREIMSFLRGNVWVFNISYLLRGIDDPHLGNEVRLDAMSSSSIDNFADLGLLLDAQTRSEGGGMRTFDSSGSENADLQKAIAQEVLQKPAEIQKGYLDYVGGRSLLKTAGKWLRNFWAMLKELWTKVKNAFKNVIGLIGRHLRRAYTTITDGFGLLFGKRTENSGDQIFSKMDFDFDMIVLAKANASIEHIEAHGQRLLERSQAMSNLFFGLGKVVRIVFDLNSPSGWLKLGLRIVDEIKDAAKELFDQGHLQKA